MSVIVRAPARLHMGLIDCGNATRRLFGGLGVSIASHYVEVHAQPASQWSIDLPESFDDSRLRSDVTTVCLSLQEKGCVPHRIELRACPMQHAGLGSKTSILLSVAQSVNLSSGAILSREELVVSTGRGGTSGIGINTFFEGGVVADMGHREPQHSRVFAPSSRRAVASVPRPNVRIAMPSLWRVALFADLNADRVRIEGSEELRIFKEVMPLPDTENLRTLAAVYHGVVPAILESDYAALAESITDLHACGMKRIEAKLQSGAAQQFMTSLQEQGIACGLSSFGPTMYCIVRGGEDEATAQQRSKDLGLSHLGTSDFDNVGATHSIR